MHHPLCICGVTFGQGSWPHIPYPTLGSIHYGCGFLLTYTTNGSPWTALFTTDRGRNTAACGMVKAARDTAGGPRPGTGVALGRQRA